MNPVRDTNAEVDALGLDVESLVGLHVREIREALREQRDAALIVGTDGVPDGWPREILDVDAASDRLAWFFQSSDGAWLPFAAYSYRKYVVEFGRIPACIYTRRPAASPFARVRPIVDLLVDASGACVHASARWAERVLQQARAQREPAPPPAPPIASPHPLAPPRFRAAIEKIEQMIGLAPPREGFDLELDVGETGRLPIRMTCVGEQRGFLVCDAREVPRLDAQVAPGDVGRLRLAGAGAEMPIAAIPSTGVRVALLDRAGEARLWLDAYAGQLHARIGDERGIERAVKAMLLVGPTDGLVQPPRPTAVTLALMAGGSSNSAADLRSPADTALVVDVAAGTLSIRDAGGAVRAQFAASALDGEHAAYVFAEGRDAPPPDRQ